MKNKFDILKYGKKLLRHTSKSLNHAGKMLDQSFINAVELISETKGKIILIGMGKSGIVAKKLSSTMVSMGFLSYYLHPSEALHGDLGIIRENDLIIALSNSGETEELLNLIKAIEKLKANNKIIAITSKNTSSLANKSDIVLLTHVSRETMDANDALMHFPATSSAVTLALGDALSFTAIKVRGFKTDSLAKFHPAGSLGKLFDILNR